MHMCMRNFDEHLNLVKQHSFGIAQCHRHAFMKFSLNLVSFISGNLQNLVNLPN